MEGRGSALLDAEAKDAKAKKHEDPYEGGDEALVDACLPQPPALGHNVAQRVGRPRQRQLKGKDA